MYLITTTDATSMTARFRMPALRAERLSGVSVDAHRVTGVVPFSFGYGVGTQAPFKGAHRSSR